MKLITTLTKNSFGTGLDDLLLSKENSIFSYEDIKTNKKEKIEVIFKENFYYYLNKKYSAKKDIRSKIANFLELNAKIQIEDNKPNIIKNKLLKKENISQKFRKAPVNFITEAEESPLTTREKIEIEKSRMLKKIKVLSHPIIQGIPFFIGGTSLIGGSLLGLTNYWASLFFLLLGGSIIYGGSQLIGNRLNKHRIRYAKLNKI